MMPAGAAKARGSMGAALEGVVHEKSTDPELEYALPLYFAFPLESCYFCVLISLLMARKLLTAIESFESSVLATTLDEYERANVRDARRNYNRVVRGVHQPGFSHL